MSDSIDELTREMMAAGFIPSLESETVEITDEDMETLAAELDTQDEKSKIYEAQTEVEVVIPSADVENTVVAADSMSSVYVPSVVQATFPVESGTGATASAVPSSAPKRGRPASTIPKLAKTPRVKYVKPTTGVAVTQLFTQLGIAYDDMETQTTYDSLPIKIREKVLNLAEHYMLGHALHTYTDIGLKFIKSVPEFALSDVVDHLNKTGYTIGTSRSQGQQVVKMLETFGAIVKNTSGKFEVNGANFIFA